MQSITLKSESNRDQSVLCDLVRHDNQSIVVANDQLRLKLVFKGIKTEGLKKIIMMRSGLFRFSYENPNEIAFARQDKP